MQLVALDLEGVLVPELRIAFLGRTGIPGLRRTPRGEPDHDELTLSRLERRHGLGIGLGGDPDAMGPAPSDAI